MGATNHNNKKGSLYDRLAQPPWDGLDLVVPVVVLKKQQQNENGINNNDNNNNNTVTSTLTQQQVTTAASSVSAVTSSSLAVAVAVAAGSGNDPHKLLDDIAESLLDGPYTVLPAKQKLFAGVKPMVENLL